MDQSKLSVEAIKDGTVIDHIPAGHGPAILRQFDLLSYGTAVTVGFHLPSNSTGSKDIIKITGVRLGDEDADRLMLFAPEATVNDIENFTVIRKRKPTLPETVAGMFRCPNTNCASHSEPVRSFFFVKSRAGSVRLQCRFCEKTFARETVTES